MRHHDFDGLSMAFGLVFTAVGLVLLSGDPVHGTISLSWAGPIVSIGIGVVVTLGARLGRQNVLDRAPDAED